MPQHSLNAANVAYGRQNASLTLTDIVMIVAFSCAAIFVMARIFVPANHRPKKEQKAGLTPITANDCAGKTGLAKVVCLAETFKATLTPDQQALLQLTYSKGNAVRWSNFPQQFSRPNRVGLSLAALNPTQLAAFKTLMGSVLQQDTLNEGFDEMEGVMAADDYLGSYTKRPETFGQGNFYVAFLGVPSTTQLWELMFGGHHYAFANTYNNGKITGVTPSFRGVEPMASVTANGRNYQPVEQERQAFAATIGALAESEKNVARLTATFDNILLGPGADGQFPQTKQGIKIGGLSKAAQQQIIQAISLYVNDLDAATAKPIMAKYIAELPDTYLCFSGTGTMNVENDYIRLDGPSLWLEYSVQPGRDIPNTTHPHSVWRDKTGDYGGN